MTDSADTSLPDAAHRPSSRDLPSLDGLRALSIFLVLAGHASEERLSKGSAHLLASLANYGVCVFFVISGYLITTILLRDAARTGEVHLGRFYFRRTLRIFPPYYIYLAVLAVAYASHVWTRPPNAIWWPSVFYLTDFVESHDILLAHTWSLSLEEQFYLVWPVLLALCIRYRGHQAGSKLALRWSAVALILAPVVRVLIFAVTRDGQLATLPMFDYVIAGSFFAILHKRMSWPVARACSAGSLGSALIVAGGIFTLILHILFLAKTRWMFAAAITVVRPLEAILLSLFVVWTVAQPDRVIGRVLNLRLLRVVGVGSYSLYLWQELFVGTWSPFHLSLVLSLVCAFAFSAISYFIIERPALRIRGMIERSVFN